MEFLIFMFIIGFWGYIILFDPITELFEFWIETYKARKLLELEQLKNKVEQENNNNK